MAQSQFTFPHLPPCLSFVLFFLPASGVKNTIICSKKEIFKVLTSQLERTCHAELNCVCVKHIGVDDTCVR